MLFVQLRLSFGVWPPCSRPVGPATAQSPESTSPESADPCQEVSSLC